VLAHGPGGGGLGRVWQNIGTLGGATFSFLLNVQTIGGGTFFGPLKSDPRRGGAVHYLEEDTLFGGVCVIWKRVEGFDFKSTNSGKNVSLLCSLPFFFGRSL